MANTVNIRVNVTEATEQEINRIADASGLDRGYIVDLAIDQFSMLDTETVYNKVSERLEAEKAERLNRLSEVLNKKAK